MSVLRSLRGWVGFFFGSSTKAPDTVTAAANAIAGKPPVAPTPAPPEITGDGTHVGDDPDAGAIGG